ncbi:hypothetical protein Ae201684P_008864 [Aphanomyces euteiches]|nr:hypothetical protein Ae201684P_008864 [Aphanomyces euteiches]
MSGRRRIVWEPIREAQMVAIGAEKQALFQEKVARSYMQKLSAWQALQTNNLQVKKQAWLAFQKAKAQSHRAENAFLISQRQANEAVAFSTRASKTLSDEQPWDPLENANNWRLLVSNRSAELDAKEKEVQMEISRRLWFDAEMNEAASRAQTEQAKVYWYRPDDSVKHEIWIEARFVRLLMTKLRFRDPHAAIIRHHSSMGALRLIHGNASCKKYLENKEKAFAVMDLVKLNAFSGAITVGRVDFFRSRESLETKLFASHWWRDSLHGRKRGRGEEVYRQSTNVG